MQCFRHPLLSMEIENKSFILYCCVLKSVWVWHLCGQTSHPKDSYLTGDFVTNVTQINSQSDLISMANFAAHLTSQSDPLST